MSDTATVAATFSWLPFIDAALPIGDIIYGVIVGVTAAAEYGSQLLSLAQSILPQIPGVVDKIQNLFTGGGSSNGGWDPNRFLELINRIKERILNGLKDVLNQSHLDAARAEKLGKGKSWPSGKLMDHYTEVKKYLDGLYKEITRLKNALDNPDISEEVRKNALELLSKLEEYYTSTSNYIEGK